MLKKLTLFFLLITSLNASGQTYTAKDSNLVDTILLMAMDAFYQDLEQSLEYTHDALRIARIIDYKKGICGAYNGLGIIYGNLGQPDSSEYYTTRNIDARFALKNRDDSLGAYIDMLNLSSLYSGRGQISEALNLCLESMNYCDDVNDTQCMMAARASLGRIYLKCEEIEDAKAYFEEQLDLIRHLTFQQAKVEAGATYLSLARCYLVSEEYKESLTYLDSAESNFKEVKDSLDLIKTSLVYAEVYLDQERYDEAFRYIKPAYNLSIAKSLAYENTVACYYMCLYYRGKEQLDSARYYGNISYEQAQNLQNTNLLKALYLEMGKIYSDAGEYKKASEFFEKHIILEDSLYSETMYRELQAERFSEQLNKQEAEKNKIKQDNIDKAETIRIWKIAGIILLITKTIMIVLAISLYRKRKKYKKAIKELNTTNQIKNRLLAIISHDLRSPLSSLYSVISLTKQKVLSEEEKDRLYGKLEQNLNATLALVDNLLYWTKDQINAIKPEHETFDIYKKVNGALDVYSSVAKDKDITITTSLADKHLCHGDRGMINIVVRNLLSNAIKYTNRGGEVSIITEVVNNKLRVKIKDSGIGMEEEKLKTLFTQANKSELGTEKEKGTGLGLLVSYEFVKTHNSELIVESSPGKGTTFYFDLTLADDVS